MEKIELNFFEWYKLGDENCISLNYGELRVL